MHAAQGVSEVHMLRFLTILTLSLVPLSIAGCSSSTEPSGRDGGTDGMADATPDSSSMECTAPQMYFEPGCGSENDPQAIIAGCYQPCADANDTSCPVSTSCKMATTNPCICDPGAACCAACGAGTFLCLPGPYELPDLTTPCDGAHTGQDVLDLAQSYDLTLTYMDDGRTSPARLEIGYSAGSITCHPSVPSGPGVGAPDLPARVELQVTLTFTTPDGAFAEMRDTTVSAMDGFGGATINTQIPVGEFQGTFSPMLSRPVANIRIAGELMGASATGNVFADSMPASPTGPTETRSFASWATP